MRQTADNNRELQDTRVERDPPLAETYARKALALDPDLAEARVSPGQALSSMRKFTDAERQLRRGIELNPGYVHAHQIYAGHLMMLGRLEEALSESEQALHLDPFSLPVNNLRGLILIGLRQYSRAEESARAAAQLDPQASGPLRQLARIYWLQHRVPEALAAEHRVALLKPEPTRGMLLRGEAEVDAEFARHGFRGACLRSAQLKERARAQDREIAFQYGLLEDRQKVLDWVAQQAGLPGYEGIDLIQSAPEFDFLRSDPQFQSLLRRLGLPP